MYLPLFTIINPDNIKSKDYMLDSVDREIEANQVANDVLMYSYNS